MHASDTPLDLKQLRRTPPPFQVTFETPLKNLKPFVEAIVTGGEVTGATALIDQEVFDPTNLIRYLDRHGTAADRRHSPLIATSRSESGELLEVLLSDWLDFIFLPEPKSFVLYADHDEFTTLYAHKRSNLNRVTQALVEQGFQPVAFTRESLGRGR